MLPLPTTTVTFYAMAEPEPGEGRTASPIASGVPAHIGSASGSERIAAGGGASRVDAVCWSELVENIPPTGIVVNDETGDEWEIVAVFNQRGLGLDHTRTQLRATSGRVT